jgi:hypothetical protein
MSYVSSFFDRTAKTFDDTMVRTIAQFLMFNIDPSPRYVYHFLNEAMINTLGVYLPEAAINAIVSKFRRMFVCHSNAYKRLGIDCISKEKLDKLESMLRETLEGVGLKYVQRPLRNKGLRVKEKVGETYVWVTWGVGEQVGMHRIR